MLNLSNKRFSEIVFDFLNDNLSEQQRKDFRETIRVEWDGEHRCIDFYTSEDADEPEYRLYCTRARVNPAKLWVYWCSNYPDPREWIPEVWPGVLSDHFLKKWNAFRERFSGDEAMNRFFRELSSDNQQKLLNYIETHCDIC